jgi:hypothetical protein
LLFPYSPTPLLPLIASRLIASRSSRRFWTCCARQNDRVEDSASPSNLSFRLVRNRPNLWAEITACDRLGTMTGGRSGPPLIASRSSRRFWTCCARQNDRVEDSASPSNLSFRLVRNRPNLWAEITACDRLGTMTGGRGGPPLRACRFSLLASRLIASRFSLLAQILDLLRSPE